MISCKVSDLVQLTVFNRVKPSPVFIVQPDNLNMIYPEWFRLSEHSDNMNNKGCDVSAFHLTQFEFVDIMNICYHFLIR